MSSNAYIYRPDGIGLGATGYLSAVRIRAGVADTPCQQFFRSCRKVIAHIKYQLSSCRRGREGSYPPSPRTDPGVRIFAPGSSDSLASAILHLSAIPCGEVCLAIPALHVRTRFPMQAATACQPLPRVNGSPVSEYCGLIRPPKVFGLPTLCFGSAYLFHPSGCTTLASILPRNHAGFPSS